MKDWESSGCMVDGVPTLKCLEVVFNNLLILSAGIFVLGLFIMFVIGAYEYLTSFGSPEKIKKAQGTFRSAIIGLAVFLSSYLILKTIDFLFLGNANKIFQFTIGGP